MVLRVTPEEAKILQGEEGSYAPKRKAIQWEARLQRECVAAFYKIFPNRILIGSANGAYLKGGARAGHFLKLQGMRDGVSDIFIAEPVRNNFGKIEFCGLWFEVKHGDNKLTDDQEEFIDDMKRRGYYATWGNTLENFVNTVRWYFSLDSVILPKIKR